MKLLITSFACAFNIYSLLFFISDTEKITDILGKMNLKAKVYSAAAILLVSLSVMWSRVYLVLWLVLEYLGIIWWYGRPKRDHLRNVQRGLLCIVTVIVTELTIIFLYRHRKSGIHRKDQLRNPDRMLPGHGTGPVFPDPFPGNKKDHSRLQKGLNGHPCSKRNRRYDLALYPHWYLCV